MPFATARFLLIFIATVLSPTTLLLISLFLSCLGSLVLLLWGGTIYWCLASATALSGLGHAALFSSFFTWLQTRVEMTNKLGGFLTLSSSSGAQVGLTVLGQLIEQTPIALPYITLSALSLCFGLFGLATLIERHIKRTHEKQIVEEEMNELMGK